MSEAVKAATAIVSRFREGSFSDEALASELGYSAVNGGAFRQKAADLRKYGVITGRGTTLNASPLARAIFADRPGERDKAVLQMLSNIPLFKALHEHFGDRIPDDRAMTTLLLNITGAPRPDIDNTLAKLRDAYKDACSTIPPMQMGTKSPTSTPSLSLSTEGVPLFESQPGGNRFVSRTAEYEFTVQDDAEAIQSVIDQLTSRKTILEKRQQAATKPRQPDGPGRTNRTLPPPAGASPEKKE